GRAEDLDAFFGEVIIEAGEREAGTIDGRLADLAMKTDALALEFQVQLVRMRAIKTLDGDDRDVLALIAARTDRLSYRFVGHRILSLSRDGKNFHSGSHRQLRRCRQSKKKSIAQTDAFPYASGHDFHSSDARTHQAVSAFGRCRGLA